MAILVCDSFEAGVFAGNTDFALNGFTVSGTLATQIIWDSTGDRFGGGAAKIRAESPQPYIMKVFRQAVSGTTLRLAFGLTLSSGSLGGGTAPYLVMITDAGATRWWQLRLDAATGALIVSKYDDNNTPTAAFTAAATINDGLPHHIEIEILAHTSTGVLNLWVDGVADPSNISSGDTSDAASGDVTTLDRIYLGQGRRANVAVFVWYDDLVVWDDSGSEFTGQLGVHRMSVQTVDADGVTNNFTPSAGSNFQNVDETSPNSDTDYNEGITATNKDQYGVVAMALNPTIINGVNVKSFVKNPDVGTKTFREIAYHGGSTANGTTHTALTAYSTFESFFYQNPSTSAAWAQSEVGAMEIGLEIVS